jgi:hypothetical protein
VQCYVWCSSPASCPSAVLYGVEHTQSHALPPFYIWVYLGLCSLQLQISIVQRSSCTLGSKYNTQFNLIKVSAGRVSFLISLFSSSSNLSNNVTYPCSVPFVSPSVRQYLELFYCLGSFDWPLVVQFITN